MHGLEPGSRPAGIVDDGAEGLPEVQCAGRIRVGVQVEPVEGRVVLHELDSLFDEPARQPAALMFGRDVDAEQLRGDAVGKSLGQPRRMRGSAGATRLDRPSTTWVSRGAYAASGVSPGRRKDQMRSSTTGRFRSATVSAISRRRSQLIVREVGLCNVGWR